jgi:replicative DNA helicase
MNGKLQPQATDLEEAVLGAVMLSKNAIHEVIDILTPESFYSDANKAIWGVILELSHSNLPIDILTVVNALRNGSKLDEVGGAYYISKLTDKVASAAHIVYHAKLIQQKYLLRQFIDISNEVGRMAYDDAADPMDIETYLSNRLLNLNNVNGGDVTLIKDVIPDVVSIAEKAGVESELTGINLGIAKKNKVYGGRQNGDLIIKAARPAMGKTADALCEAVAAARSGKKVLFFSLEMTKIALVQRICALVGSVHLRTLSKGVMNTADFTTLNEAIAHIEKMGIFIADNIYELNAINSKARKMKQGGNCDIIYIDYIQLIVFNGKGNREQDVSTISRSLKILAKDLNIPVIALSQLNRAVESRGGDKRPMLADLRESGAIEQDADIVEFLYRPEYYGITDVEGFDTTEELAFLIIAKHRGGALEDIPMRFEGRFTRFSDWETPSYSNHLEPNEEFEAPF